MLTITTMFVINLDVEKAIIHIVEDNKVIRESVSKFISFHEEFSIGEIERET